MGLDTVEMVIGWENALGVTISDADAGRCQTPRAATDLLAAKLHATHDQPGACLTLRAFHRIRTGLINGAGVPRERITPKGRLRALLPDNRKERWQAAHKASGLPELPKLNWGVGLLFSPITVTDLLRWIVAHVPASLKAPDEPWTYSQVRLVVRSVVAESTGTTDFSDDAHFVRDLGLD